MTIPFPYLGFGVGLRPCHYEFILEHRPPVDWFEIISENYMVDGGRPIHTLRQVREFYPVVMHGVSLSIGSTDPLNTDYLKSLKKLAQWLEPAWISDHLCWTGVGGHNAHDLLPLPYTEETLRHVCARILQVQEILGRPLVLENVSSYLEYEHSEMTEWKFLTEVARRSDCRLLVDLNNIYVSARNHGFDPLEYINALPADRVVQFHLAGHTDKGDFLLDTHDHPVCDGVWNLYKEAKKRFHGVSTLVEWDDAIPEFPVLLNEIEKARAIK